MELTFSVTWLDDKGRKLQQVYDAASFADAMVKALGIVAGDPCTSCAEEVKLKQLSPVADLTGLLDLYLSRSQTSDCPCGKPCTKS